MRHFFDTTFFFFKYSATTGIYTLSLHDALPILDWVDPTTVAAGTLWSRHYQASFNLPDDRTRPDRKSTRLNSSHTVSSYAVFCLKKKKNTHSICDEISHRGNSY